MTSPDEITQGLERCYAQIAADPRLREDFARSRTEFFAQPELARAPGSELRHLEWYFLERPNPILGSVPAAALASEGDPGSSGFPATLRAALLGSIPGAFEVTTVTGGTGCWVRDLFTRGEHPLDPSPSMADLRVGDLVVGRLFPGTSGTYLASPAIAVFRSPELLAAVRADLAVMRGARRGVLRIQQLELERLFHEHDSAWLQAARPGDQRARACRALQALGLEEVDARKLLAEVGRAALSGSGSDVTELMNRLAFETRVDLDGTRQILLEAWHEECRDLEMPGPGANARAALAAFDRGRGEGKDLEALFRQLERDLGLDSDAGNVEYPEEALGAPDFPGVVGAMVEEFLWEAERERGVDQVRSFGRLRVLAEYAADIGVFEDLGRVRLLDFAARWLLDETDLSPVEIEEVFEALLAFCAWTEESHRIPLRRELEPVLQGIRGSVARLAGARSHCSGNTPAGSWATVLGVETGRVQARSGPGEPVWVGVPEALSARLRPGDVVRLTSDGLGIGRAYPPELGGALTV